LESISGSGLVSHKVDLCFSGMRLVPDRLQSELP